MDKERRRSRKEADIEDLMIDDGISMSKCRWEDDLVAIVDIIG